jgi:hypothetical protein
VPLPSEVLQRTYRNRERYLSEFTQSLDAAIEARALLAADRVELVSRQTDKATEAFEAAKLPAVPRHRRRRP